MDSITLEALLECFGLAQKEKCEFIAVKVKMTGFEKEEVIINHIDNVIAKSEYYKNAYREDLKLKNAPDAVQIVDFTYGNSFEEIQCFFDVRG